jgi:hypothetical protein
MRDLREVFIFRYTFWSFDKIGFSTIHCSKTHCGSIQMSQWIFNDSIPMENAFSINAFKLYSTKLIHWKELENNFHLQSISITAWIHFENASVDRVSLFFYFFWNLFLCSIFLMILYEIGFPKTMPYL